jgi:mannose-1-phosphate guanylyltransferase
LKPSANIIANHKEHLSLTKKLCPEIPEENIIIEPALRDTASCIGYAACIIAKRYPEEVMSIIYADHLITKKDEFAAKLKLAEKIAQEENTLNIIEVSATEPNTNYGYVKLNKLLKTVDHTHKKKKYKSEVYSLGRFTEKPDLKTAKAFLQSGKYLWNTGIYVWKAKNLLKKYKKLKPRTYNKLKIIQDSLGTKEETEIINSIYPTLEKVSIDYAIMEQADPKKVRIIKANLGWSDVGTWEAIWDELSDFPEQNITRGHCRMLDTKSSLVYADGHRKVIIIGLKDVVVVDTEDGLLVADKKESKRIKEVL